MLSEEERFRYMLHPLQTDFANSPRTNKLSSEAVLSLSMEIVLDHSQKIPGQEMWGYIGEGLGKWWTVYTMRKN